MGLDRLAKTCLNGPHNFCTEKYTSVSYIVCNGLFMSRPRRNRSEPLLVCEIRWSIVIPAACFAASGHFLSRWNKFAQGGIEAGFLKSTMSKLVFEREAIVLRGCTRRNARLCKRVKLFLLS